MTKHTTKDFEEASASAFKQMERLLGRSVEIQEEDLVKRAEADVIQQKDKELSVNSTIANFDIDLKKAGRGIREQGLNASGAFIKTLMPPQQNPNEIIMNTVAMARSLVALWDATQDEADIKKKFDDYKTQAGVDNKGNKLENNGATPKKHPKERDQEKTPTPLVLLAGSSASSGPGTGMP